MNGDPRTRAVHESPFTPSRRRRGRLTRREAATFAALTDTVVAPEPPLPPVYATDAVASFAALLAASPRPNRLALRAALHAIDLAPLALGHRARLRRLPRPARTAVVDRLDRSPAAPAVKVLRALGHLSYYGDDGVMRTLGYDPEPVLARAAAAPNRRAA